MEEYWLPIANYEGIYEASNFGNVRSLDRYITSFTKKGTTYTCFYQGKLLKPIQQQDIYLKIHLKINCNSKLTYIHRIIAETFLPNPEKKPQVNHIDGDKTNNTLDNLEWATRSENMIHAYKMGLKTGYRAQNTLSDNQKKEIRDDKHNSNNFWCKKYSIGNTTVKKIKLGIP